MKKLLMIISILLLITGCKYRDVKSKYVIDKIKDRKGMQELTTYRVKLLDASGLEYNWNASGSFWFADSIGKYNIGDELKLIK